MKIVFADTSFFIAFSNRKDGDHHAAQDFVKTFRGRFVTTEWILVELGNFWSASPRRTSLANIVHRVRQNPFFRIISAVHHSFDAGLELYAERADKQWSLTDCISFVIMQDLGITEALTADHHFEQAGFTILLK